MLRHTRGSLADRPFLFCLPVWRLGLDRDIHGALESLPSVGAILDGLSFLRTRLGLHCLRCAGGLNQKSRFGSCESNLDLVCHCYDKALAVVK